jgi:hypothetical protein
VAISEPAVLTADGRNLLISVTTTGNIILGFADMGTSIYIQQSADLIHWSTLPNGPHTSPFDAGSADTARFFRFSDVP